MVRGGRFSGVISMVMIAQTTATMYKDNLFSYYEYNNKTTLIDS